MEQQLNSIDNSCEAVHPNLIEPTKTTPPFDNLKKSNNKNNTFKEKEFSLRPSLLDCNSAQNVVGSPFQNFVLGAFIMVVMSNMAYDYMNHSNPMHHLWLIKWNFAKLPLTLVLWLTMFLSTYFLFLCMSTWSQIETKQSSLKSQAFYAFAYVAYVGMFFYYSISSIFIFDLNCACSYVITCENTRIAMKFHSFVRENFERGIRRKNMLSKSRDSSAKHNNDEDADNKQDVAQDPMKKRAAADWPTIGQFTYFMFCPTFIYRDEYPRNEKRNWGVVFRHFLGCLGSIYFVNLSFTNLIYPYYSDLDYNNLSISTVVYLIFPSALAGAVCLFIGIFYGLLHSWLSMFAELLRFGDRHFYSSWWSSKNMAQYYRDWNLVVHEWLYSYVYRDLSQAFGGRIGAVFGQIMVFFLSSLAHEYWFAISLRMFYPAIFTVYFVFGGVFFLVSQAIRLSPKFWNVMMWWNLLFGMTVNKRYVMCAQNTGTGLFVSCYATEWYAIKFGCHEGHGFANSWVNFFTPKVWSCIKFK